MKELSHQATQVAYDSDAFQQAFSVGKTKLHQELNAGRLKARRLGRKIIILHDDAMSWLANLPERDQDPGKKVA